jgi:hypothetical protein
MCRVQREKRRKESRRDEDWLHVNLVHPSRVLCHVKKSLLAPDIHDNVMAYSRPLNKNVAKYNCEIYKIMLV